MSDKIKKQFIDNAGGSVVSKNIINKKGKHEWIFREKSINDNGWGFFSDIDDETNINNSRNLEIYDFNTVAEIEPAIVAIYLLAVGTDLELITKDNKKYFNIYWVY
ncbi:DUF2185 domain-containing protein [Clostridium estertheticum]|uniref:immunity protein Imm33 domain-containing protein n=1 Tax=Clostridium estertheticum TaxID=238834 RepID=UPI001CF43E11|nr:DUF2185 domain-containing protein [Clostridium estertheticum]MCB2360945.1 DUF2185 domain-containing protein [Clostridium estertheticum]